MAVGKTLRLVIPGLLGPWPDATQPEFPRPRAPALTRLLSRATASRTTASGYDSTLFDLFSIAPSSDRDLPVAAVTRLADGGEPDARYWLRADPVHLRADLRQVLLVDARHLAITADEARALVDECNRHFSGDEWRLEARHPERWYLGLRSAPAIRTTPLADAIGKDVNPRLPRGSDSRRWNTALTELQMLLHASPVNQAREATDRPIVNSVWPWGGGVLPEAARPPADEIYGDDALCRGLARLADSAISPSPPTADVWLDAAGDETDSLVVLDSARLDRADSAPERWREHLEALERDWFSPCQALLKRGLIEELALYPCNGRMYRISARQSRYFWRGQRPLSAFLADA